MSSLHSPEQYCLFHLQHPEWKQLREAKEKLMSAAKAPNTLKAYAESWRVFSEWCAEYGCERLPASSATVEDFVTWAAKLRKPAYRLETIGLAMSAIRHYHLSAEHPNPVDSAVRGLISGIAREDARNGRRVERAGKKELTVAVLRKICRTLSDEKEKDVRDRALILLGFASALRRAELAELELAHVSFEERGLHLYISYSKTDQEGKGRHIGIPPGKVAYTCPVRALRAWLKVRGDWRGPLFVRFNRYGASTYDGITGQTVAYVLKRALERIGQDPDLYGAHSLRSGMITTAANNKKVNLRDIMERSGHKSVESVMRYIKPSQAFHVNPLKGVL